MWKFSFLIIYSCLILYDAFSQQYQYNFEEGNISDWVQSSSGHWIADTVYPISGSSSLHHCYDNQEAGFDAISYRYDLLNLENQSAIWRFAVRHANNPSSSNNWAVWLIAENGAENMSPDGINSGYLVGVNYTGSDDYLKIWRKTDKDITELVSTGFNWQESVGTDNPVWIKIEKTPDGKWSIFYDLTGTDKWIFLTSTKDTKVKNGNNFGIFYRYTSSQDQKFWIDDIFIEGVFIKDIKPPEICSFTLADKRSIKIRFSEPIDTAYAESICRLNKKEFPSEYRWITNKEIVLVFDEQFKEENILELYGYPDVSGNIAGFLQITFEYYPAKKFDVIFTEIMADPIPSNGLPEFEYLEICNRSMKDINLRNWLLVIGNDSISLPELTLSAGNYLLICDDNNVDKYIETESKLGLKLFPAISNEGEIIQLFSENRTLIHAVDFTKEWYESVARQEGGWSLEMKDILNPCISLGNWSASKDASGGTPGEQNSNPEQVTDTIRPFVRQLFFNANKELQLVFSESMDSISLAEQANFTADNTQAFIPYNISMPFAEQVSLKLMNDLTDCLPHQLYLSPNIRDCSGNPVLDRHVLFGVPQQADSSDIIVNELLFESTEDIPEFIEIYNHSQKIMNLRNYLIGYFDSFSQSYEEQMIITRDNYYMFPGEYIVLTSDKVKLCNSYSIADHRKVIQPDKWKNLLNDGGRIVLISAEDKIIDEACFMKDMHFSLLIYTAGISLERISAEMPGIAKNNWHSASSGTHYASPGMQNSQSALLANDDSFFHIEPEEISPDNDGFRDFLTISYQFDNPGYLISISIFNSEGERVKDLANNELCGIQGKYFWEGLDENEERLPLGYYIVFCHAMHPQGDKKQKKKTVLLLPQKN